MHISEDTKNKIIEMYYKDNKRINTILNRIAPNGEIKIEDVYTILNEYKTNNPQKAVKIERIVSLSKVSDDEILSLIEQGLSYNNMIEYFNERGLKVSYAALSARCIDIANKTGKERKDLRRKVKGDIPNNLIIELREQGLSYKKIAEYLNERGIKISCSTVTRRGKNIYNTLGKKDQDLRKVNISNDEITELRKRGLSFKDIAEYYKEKGISVTSPTIGILFKKNAYKIDDIKSISTKGVKFDDSIDEKIFMLRVRRSIL